MTVFFGIQVDAVFFFFRNPGFDLYSESTYLWFNTLNCINEEKKITKLGLVTDAHDIIQSVRSMHSPNNFFISTFAVAIRQAETKELVKKNKK